MTRKLLALALLPAAGLSGCALLDLATDERPHGAQRDAIGDLFDQTATVATVFDDPDAADASDLATLLTFDHFVFLVAPDLAPASSGAARIADPRALECLTSDGAGTVTASGCAVTLGDGRTCIVDGTISGSGNLYTGAATMSGEGCPAASFTFDVELVGPSDSPESLTATLAVSFEDGTTSYSGSAELEIALAGDCTVPSDGTLDVTVRGTYGGSPVDGTVTLAFHSTPECGYVTIE